MLPNRENGSNPNNPLGGGLGVSGCSRRTVSDNMVRCWVSNRAGMRTVYGENVSGHHHWNQVVLLRETCEKMVPKPIIAAAATIPVL